MNEAHRKLLADGYCVIEGVLEPTVLDHVRRVSGDALTQATPDHRARNRSQGSLINIADFPGYAELIGNARGRNVFEQLNFADPRFSGGYLISKPPSGPPLFWHQDWWGWDDPIAYTDEIAPSVLHVLLDRHLSGEWLPASLARQSPAATPFSRCPTSS